MISSFVNQGIPMENHGGTIPKRLAVSVMVSIVATNQKIAKVWPKSVQIPTKENKKM